MTMDDHQEPKINTLAALRETTGLTTEEVGQKMGVNAQRVRAIEARFPSLNYDTLVRYMEAIGGNVQLAVGHTHIKASDLIPDPTKAGTRKYLLEKASQAGRARMAQGRSAAAEELPLEQGTPDPSGDDTGRNVDETDTEGHQRDREHRKEA
jgi:transcriptional regulator with XRE-family HTH domain